MLETLLCVRLLLEEKPTASFPVSECHSQAPSWGEIMLGNWKQGKKSQISSPWHNTMMHQGKGAMRCSHRKSKPWRWTDGKYKHQRAGTSKVWWIHPWGPVETALRTQPAIVWFSVISLPCVFLGLLLYGTESIDPRFNSGVSYLGGSECTRMVLSPLVLSFQRTS